MNRAKYHVEKMCKLLGVSSSAYYDWLKRKPRISKCSAITAAVKKEFERSKKTYGSPRIHDSLLEKGYRVSKSTVARVMKSLRLQARPRRKFVHTTDSQHGYKVFKNYLNREFKADRINEKWVSDITYIPTKKGWVYLTIIMDLADRMIVSWTLSRYLNSDRTTVECMKIAMHRRRIDRALIFHSDRGVQYCSEVFTELIRSNQLITQSMSRKANCWDNAPAESFFKTLKVELVNKIVYTDIDHVKKSIFDYIERWYNTQRKHSTNQYMTPLQKHIFLTQNAA